MSRVYVSPSTQQHNISVLTEYGSEERVMHLIAEEVATILRDNNIEVFKGQKEQSLGQMVSESNNLVVDCHVAIHSNAMGAEQSGKARGMEVWIYKGSTKGRALAECIYKELEPLTPTTDRGIKETTTLYEVRETKAPGVIIEIAFHDNMMDAAWILGNINPIAEAIAKGVCNYLGIQCSEDKYKRALRDIKKILDSVNI